MPVDTVERITLRDVPGLQVGHATDAERITGCTVVLAAGGAVGGVDVRGSAPGTRETDVVRPTGLVDRIHGVCLSGGSAFGLAAADGVMRYLAERDIGIDVGVRRVPLVPAAVLFDLTLGDPTAYPDADMGYAACVAAEGADGPLEGSVGAGTGATVGKVGWPRYEPTKGGVGSAGIRLRDGSVVAALVATNAVGNVVAADGRPIAGIREASGGFRDAEDVVLEGAAFGELARFGTNTTLAVVGTDATLDRAECRKVAQMAHDALAVAIRPVHTMWDGDTTFVLSTGSRRADLMEVGVAATRALREAIERSVRLAEGRGGIAGLADRPVQP